ncbi:MAG: cupredoxin family copper-binding protein [Acidocella sp.]|nr:cupredoxin family copper-binding protein [Acidocella sp.]
MRKYLALSLLVFIAPSAYAANLKVVIDNYAFAPTIMHVHPGDKITWINDDDVAHTVTSNQGAVLASGTIDPGQSWSFVVSTPGDYAYHCAIHPEMRGEIDVK